MVTYPPATAADTVDSDPVVTYSHASGSQFPIGTTPVTVRATDDNGNFTEQTFNVVVRDTTRAGQRRPPSPGRPG